ncbi:Membrane-associated progesterone receptor component 2 [Galemys pyrenaicus]|uniref:Membrane-associated progesterone receptor component 2 n=1 Tax=Galemys pyrenaicus TaxID=202257 RepID=A0A8J5ZQW7_GALPY|nr:Membrane-associated progesterone receptor component 2 [Galemys pyrenaicus]
MAAGEGADRPGAAGGGGEGPGGGAAAWAALPAAGEVLLRAALAALLLLGAYRLWRRWGRRGRGAGPGAGGDGPAAALPRMKKRDFSLEQLRQYDGARTPRILLAVNGKVFDVTKGGKFYGPAMTAQACVPRRTHLPAGPPSRLADWAGLALLPRTLARGQAPGRPRLRRSAAQRSRFPAHQPSAPPAPTSCPLSPAGPYGIFAGRDASRGLATFCLDREALREDYDDLSDLSAVQMESVREWEMQFREKYDYVGRLLKPGEEPSEYTDEEDTKDHSKQD